jgi:hypothetical protein
MKMPPDMIEGRPPGNGDGPQGSAIALARDCSSPDIETPPATQEVSYRRIDDARLLRLARQIHALGERPLLELFKELDRGADLRDALERYGALAPFGAFIAAHGGDRLTVARLVEVQR